MMKINLDGFDDLRRQMDDLARRARDLHGTHTVGIDKLFPRQFMLRYTDFTSFDEMVQASSFKVKSAEDFASIPADKWDRFIAARPRFANWKEMQQKATAGWTGGRLGL